jgi:hypothetical protein
MSVFDLNESIERARTRLDRPAGRRRRSDVGSSRLHPTISDRLALLLGGQERPGPGALLDGMRAFCSERGLRCPARATLYKVMGRLVVQRYPVATLPPYVAATLFNLAADAAVPGHQLAFHCFNYGGLRAMSFAAGLPWLCLYQAARMRGWRAMSRGPLLAVCRSRGI